MNETASQRDSLLYECPRCHHRAPWTDGTSKEAGDDEDEFWCQRCGHETPLVGLDGEQPDPCPQCGQEMYDHCATEFEMCLRKLGAARVGPV